MSDEKRDSKSFRDVIAKACDLAIVETHGHTFVAAKGEAILRAFVEQREAALRGRIAAASDVVDAAIAHVRRREGPSRDFVRDLIAISDALGPNPPEYVSGDVACGLAWDLGAAQAAIADLQTLTDVLADGRGEDVGPYLEARGWRKPPERSNWPQPKIGELVARIASADTDDAACDVIDEMLFQERLADVRAMRGGRKLAADIRGVIVAACRAQRLGLMREDDRSRHVAAALALMAGR